MASISNLIRNSWLMLSVGLLEGCVPAYTQPPLPKPHPARAEVEPGKMPSLSLFDPILENGAAHGGSDLKQKESTPHSGHGNESMQQSHH
jgi:hypothetical protein